MSVPTFIDWFFAWMSGIKIEFRETCKWCDGKPSVLACYETKVGIDFKNTFVAPVETPGNNHWADVLTDVSYQIQAITNRFAVFVQKLEIIWIS